MTLTGQTSDAERLVGFVAILGIVCFCVVRYLSALSRRPLAPNPWDEEINAALSNGDGVPICHRCLAPHDELTNFCANCGAPVGEYTNWLPYPYLFAVGHTLRIGTSGTFRRSPLTIAGFMLLAVVEYAVFAPVYWARFFFNISNSPGSESPASASDPPGGES